MAKKTKAFWDWFEKNNAGFLFITEVDADEQQRLLTQLLDKLHKYCDKLWFEIGGFADGTKELIITAEGDTAYFDKVTELIDSAPYVEHWEFIAFNPPMGVDFNVNFEDIELIPSEMWFLPLENPKSPYLIAIRICTDNFLQIKDNESLEPALYKMLDIVLGEKSFALDVNYIEIDDLPENPIAEGLIQLSELPAYVDWHKNKYPRNLN